MLLSIKMNNFPYSEHTTIRVEVKGSIIHCTGSSLLHMSIVGILDIVSRATLTSVNVILKVLMKENLNMFPDRVKRRSKKKNHTCLKVH